MVPSLKFRPSIERLEDRAVPATIRALAGNLLISKQVGALTIETTAVAGQVRITDGGLAPVTVNGIGSLISVTGTNAANVINVRAEASAFGGNVIVNSGNGHDTVNLSGDFGGSVTLSTGLGNDTVISNNNDVAIGGNLAWVDTTGNNTFDMNDRNYTIGGNMTLTGVGTFNQGAGGNTVVIGGSATMTGLLSGITPTNILFNGLSTTIGRALTITTRAADDVVSITSDFSVGGGFTTNLGNGDNTFVLTPAPGGTGVGGNLWYTGGSGIDVVVFGADSIVDGHTHISLGNGINTFVDTATSLYGGDLSLFGLNHTNTLVVSGDVSGSLNVTVGNGAGNTTVVTAPIGGMFRYRGGNGPFEVLTLAPIVAQTILANISFGTGDSTFSLGPNVTLSGIVRGNGGAYTFNQGTAILAPDLQLINYPI